ncbi:MAG: carbohydrate ABC transporter permease [Sphaerochaetaceae bacterium]|nr:carbohydrate ABC transporter permease [Sphaerochaetaceae bacterium]
MKGYSGIMGKKQEILRIVMTVLLFCFALLCVFPFIWMISTSFKFEIDVMEFPIRIIPKNINTKNYVRVFTKSNFPRYYLNTIKVSLITVVGELMITTMAGYSFARLRFRGKNLLFTIYLATMMVPAQVMLLPKYIYFSKLHLTNTHLALILPGFFSVFGVLLMKQGFSQVPFELTEAAYIDGANHFTIFSRLILPLVKPSLMTALLLSFTWVWNDYMNPLIFISKENLITLTVGLQRFQEDSSTNYALIMSGATVSLIPILIVFVICQKFFIESFASSGIKG